MVNEKRYVNGLLSIRENTEELESLVSKNNSNGKIQKKILIEMKKTIDSLVEERGNDKSKQYRTNNKKDKEAEREEILGLFREGYDRDKIHERTGYSLSTIIGYEAQRTWKTYWGNAPRKRREFSEDEKKSIYNRLWEEGIKKEITAEIAKDYGVPRNKIMWDLAYLKMHRIDYVKKYKLDLGKCNLRFKNDKERINFWKKVMKYRNKEEKEFILKNYLKDYL